MGSLFFVGNCAADLLLDLPRWPRPGGYIAATESILRNGGMARNASIAAARLGRNDQIAVLAHVVGRVGSDVFGTCIRSELRDAGVSDRFLRSVAGARTLQVLVASHASAYDAPKSGRFDAAAQRPGYERPMRSMVGLPGATVQREDVEGFLGADVIQPGDAVLFSGVGTVSSLTDEVFFAEASHAVHQQGGVVAIDYLLDDHVASDPKHWLRMSLVESSRHADYLFPSMQEARFLTGGQHEDGESVIENLLDIFGGGKTVGVKAGPDGSFVGRGGWIKHVRPFPVEQFVDDTGAGDVWCGAFLIGLSCFGNDLEQAAQYANAAAARSLSGWGGAAGW